MGWVTKRKGKGTRKGVEGRSGWLTRREASHITVPPKVYPGVGERKVKMGWEKWEREKRAEQQQQKNQKKKKIKKKKSKKVGVTIWWATRPV